MFHLKYGFYTVNQIFNKFSTSGIITAVLASKPKKIAIWDNAHPSHKNSAKLSGAEIVEYSLELDQDLDLYKAITFEKVKKIISEHKPDTIIITSPTYENPVFQ